MTRWLGVGLAIALAACASPPPSLAPPSQSPQGLPIAGGASCRALANELAAAITQAGVGDAQAVRIEGFDWLRVDRFTAALGRQAGGGTQTAAWLERLRALGHGSPTPMGSEQALAVAAGAHTHAPCQVAQGSGFEAGQAVRVIATDYGQDPVSGTLVGLSNDEVVVRRTDARAGTVHVHFPRAGFQVKQEQS
jgi:hypothetical protein